MKVWMIVLLLCVVTATGHGGEAEGGCKTMLAIPDWMQEAYDKDPVSVSVCASLFTSFVPIVMLLFCPAAPSRGVLHALLAFAAGSLLGDAMLHLLPHSLEGGHGHSHSHSHDHSHGGASHVEKGVVMEFLDAAHVSVPHLLFLVGLGLFFFIEKVLRVYQGEGGGEFHGHSHGPKHTANANASTGKKSILGTAAVLNLIADTTHNFTDGITIAAGFANSFPVGISTTLAVFIHEIPHEVGDYAVLLGSGFGKKGAMLSQFVTGLGNLAGTLLMSYASKWVDGAEAYVLPSMAK
eukprot:TRINITY_DN12678_c0_g1_i2.p1 TRINITY_DN12678_c0_g1~~TRINITY_DN12678_c0_g1_i2.p1  ORF type:complete len:312 (+),score=68.96 TRINITY_DN12678_c0_g1_i2:57-938(+)